MKVYFHASLTQKDKYGEYYARIDKTLRSLGYSVDSTHVTKHSINDLAKRDKDEKLVSKAYTNMLKRVLRADIVVCELSFPSSLVAGHVFTRALERGKPVLGLYYKNTTAALLRGIETERFVLVEYDENNLEDVIKLEMGDLEKLPDQRFTMLLPTDIVEGLDGVANNGLSRAEYIRNLIRKDLGTTKSSSKDNYLLQPSQYI